MKVMLEKLKGTRGISVSVIAMGSFIRYCYHVFDYGVA